MTPIKAKISGLKPGVDYEVEVAYVSHENILGDFLAVDTVTAGDFISENTVNVGSMVASTLVDEHIQALIDISTNASDIGDVAADLADEIIDRAAADGVIQTQVTSISAEITTARGGQANLNARFTVEATTAATATAAVATRATALEVSSASPTALYDRVSDRAFFTNSSPASPTTSALSTAGTVVTADNEGSVVELTGSTQAWWSRAALPVIPGTTFRYTCRNRATVDGTANVTRIGYTVYDKSWTSLASVIVSQPTRTVANGWVNDTFEVTASSILASYSTAAAIRPFIRASTNTSTVYSGSTTQIAFLRLENITDVKTIQASITTVETSLIAADTAISNTVTALSARVAKKTLPTTFDEPTFFTTSPFTSLTSNAPDIATGSVVSVTDHGQVWRSSSSATNEAVAHKGYLPLVAGRSYRYRVKQRAIADSTNGNPLYTLYTVACFDKDKAFISSGWVNLTGSFATFVVADGWITNDIILTTTGIRATHSGACFIRAYANKWSSVSAPNGQIEVELLELTDITDEQAIQAQVDIQAGAIVDLEGRVEAYWEVNLSTGISGIDAFLRARVDDDESVLGFGADLIGLFNRTEETWLPALKVAGGDVTVYGNLIAGKGILLGTGAKWPVALQAKQFTITDGTAFFYDGGTGVLDLGSTPEFDFLIDGLDPLAAGEAYDLSMSAADGIGATPRLKISTPGTTTGYSKGPQSSDSGGTPKFQLSKGADPDANGNNYVFAVTVRFSWTASSIHNGKTILYEAEVPVYYKKAGVWTLAGSITVSDEVLNSGTGARTQDVVGSATITLPAAPTDFGMHNPTSSQMGWDNYDFLVSHTTAAQTLLSVTWSNTAASGTRTATPGGKTGKVIVRPKNVTS